VNDLAIGDYALLSDCHSAALVSRTGSIDWLCAPRFDGPSVFGRLLDARAGHWSIRPAGEAEVSRRYLPETMVMETIFRTPGGTLQLVDAIAFGQGERGHDIGIASLVFCCVRPRVSPAVSIWNSNTPHAPSTAS
jgi:GH15 family glucan-1,4-alpha-glucosidase